MAEPDQQAEKKSDCEFTTDEIIAVYEHVAKNEKSWPEIIADHGLDPIRVARACRVFFETGNGQQLVAIKALALGLQFGAMRLDPVEYDEKATPPCGCFFCTIRRATEAEAGESEGGGGDS